MPYRKYRGQRNILRDTMGMSSGLGKTLDKGTSFVLNNNKSRSIKVALVVKNLSPNAGDVGGLDSIPGLGRSPGGGHGNPP